MDLMTLREFFGWMTLINLVLYFWAVFMTVCCRNLVVGISSKLFGVSEEAGKGMIYGYLGGYKLLFITFNLVPWLALVFMS
jgi:hypothetical protein